MVARSKRFGETAEEYRLLAAFTGDAVRRRMDHVRDVIVGIRRDLHRGDTALMRQADESLRGLAPSARSLAFKTRLKRLLATEHGYADVHPEAADRDYSAVWLYTSTEGYDGAFTFAKRAFRTADASDADLHIATLLVELVTMDLYNYWHRDRRAVSFEGWVWRGMWMTTRDFHDLERRSRRPDVQGRYRSIPLALDSSSTDRDAALEFIKSGKGDVPVLQRIRVLGLSEPSLARYAAAFPQSPVSTICATDITKLSAFPREGEVLLRGGFYQLLNVYPADEVVDGRQVRVIEMVTMNTNRDHPSTPQGTAGRSARELIRSLVTAERTRFCRDYHLERGQHSDAGLYDSVLAGEAAAFRDAYGREPPWAS